MYQVEEEARSNRSKTPLLIDKLVPFLLLAVLDQAQRRQQEHHINGDKAKERGKHNVQEPVGIHAERRDTGSQARGGRGVDASRIFDEQRRVGVAAALELLLEQRLDRGSLRVPDRCQVLVHLER